MQQTAGTLILNIMKTVIITKQELDAMPAEISACITTVLAERKATIAQLKERIANLPYQEINYRTDVDQLQAESPNENLVIDLWEKTAGEQWGNSAGWKYTFRLGRKYIRLYMEYENSSDYQLDQVKQCGVSVNKMDEIVSLLEEAYSGDPVDKDQLLAIVVNRVDSLNNSY